MKSLLFVSVVVCTLCAVNAAGQSGATLSAQPQIFHVSDHPEHASQQAMGQGINLMERSGSVSDQGEMPLWEAMQGMPAARITPLGDAARAVRKEHDAAKKAVILWSN
jgi:hypothetical protein